MIAEQHTTTTTISILLLWACLVVLVFVIPLGHQKYGCGTALLQANSSCNIWGVVLLSICSGLASASCVMLSSSFEPCMQHVKGSGWARVFVFLVVVPIIAIFILSCSLGLIQFVTGLIIESFFVAYMALAAVSGANILAGMIKLLLHCISVKPDGTTSRSISDVVFNFACTYIDDYRTAVTIAHTAASASTRVHEIEAQQETLVTRAVINGLVDSIQTGIVRRTRNPLARISAENFLSCVEKLTTVILCTLHSLSEVLRDPSIGDIIITNNIRPIALICVLASLQANEIHVDTLDVTSDTTLALTEDDLLLFAVFVAVDSTIDEYLDTRNIETKRIFKENTKQYLFHQFVQQSIEEAQDVISPNAEQSST